MNQCLSSLEKFGASVKFEDYNFDNYHRLPFPLDFEMELSRALPTFEFLDEQAWKAVREQVDLDLAAKLSVYALRMATWAVRRLDPGYIYCGMIALTLDNGIRDPRDVLGAACVLYDAGLRIGPKPDDLVRKAARVATPERSNLLLQQFLFGPDHLKSLRSMGYEAVETPEGLLYKNKFF